MADSAKPSDLNRPGHVFPLRAQPGGVLSRRGHTEATIDLVSMAGFKPAGVLCELTNDDGSMAHAPEVIAFAKQHDMVVLTIEDLVAYRQAHEKRPADSRSLSTIKKPRNAAFCIYRSDRRSPMRLA